jgi:hypothetical protein
VRVGLLLMVTHYSFANTGIGYSELKANDCDLKNIEVT